MKNSWLTIGFKHANTIKYQMNPNMQTVATVPNNVPNFLFLSVVISIGTENASISLTFLTILVLILN